MRAAIVSSLALVASVVTPAYADEIMGPPSPVADVAEKEAAAPADPQPEAEADKPAGKPLELRPNPASDSKGAGGFGIGMKLAAIAAIFGGAFLLFKRRNGGFTGIRSSAAGPRIVSRTAVGMRNELLVVEVEGQRLLVGVTPAAMSTLSVLVDEPRELVEAPEKRPSYELKTDLDPRVNAYRAVIPPAEPLPTTAVEESLSRLIASARNELEDANFIRKTPVPKVTQLRSSRAKPEKATKDEAERSDRSDVPAPRRSRAVREITSIEPTSGRALEGQVRGLGSKRG